MGRVHGKEEEEAVQGEARGQLRLPEEGEAVPRHAAERGRLLELRQEEALQARRGVHVVRLEEEGQLRTGVGAGVGAGLISLLNVKRTPVIYPKTLSEVNFSTICVEDGVLLELVVPVIHPSPGPPTGTRSSCRC